MFFSAIESVVLTNSQNCQHTPKMDPDRMDQHTNFTEEGFNNDNAPRNNDIRLSDEPITHHTVEDDHRASLLDEESSTGHHRVPPLPERTLKERLVERERQARVETERARLKRQFVLNNGGVGEAVHHAGGLVEEEESVAGTVGAGSSVVAPLTEFDANNEDQELGYAMERFLSEKNAVPNEEEHAMISPPTDDPGGVVMERFLSEPVLLEPVQHMAHHHNSDDVDDALSTDIENLREQARDLSRMDQSHHSELGTTAGSIRSYSTVSEEPVNSQGGYSPISDLLAVNNGRRSVDIHDDTLTEDGNHSNFLSHEPDSPLRQVSSTYSFSQQSEEPRLFRLTEREIQEMAAIEEASIGNAPPSERDDELSEVGDLVDHFHERLDLRQRGPYSEQTHTTASFSNTTPVESHASIDGIESTSVSSHLVLSPGATSVGSVISVTANPPSEIAREEATPLIIDEDILGESHRVVQHGHFLDDKCSLDIVVTQVSSAGVINRQIRPGMTMSLPRATMSQTAVEGVRRSTSMPVIVDNFDYDKFDLGTPYSVGQDSLHELPGDLWSPASAMNVSPLHERSKIGFASPPQNDKLLHLHLDEEQGTESDTLNSRYQLRYSSASQDQTGILSRGLYQSSQPSTECIPLIGSDTKRNSGNNGPHGRAGSLLSRAESIFSSIRSVNTDDVEEETNESAKYRQSSILARAFPERFLALFVTLLVEIPVLLMVSGGSDRLCSLIGRRRYQLIMGFLPLSSAISGNCGLQASSLTTRAISHEHVTLANYVAWLRVEIGAAVFLGLTMGFILGTCSFMMSGMDFAFGLTIFVAQFVSVVTAGLTGTLAPLIFTFIFRRDAGKWGGPLETAIQDIVGSFAMVILSYRLLLLFSINIDPTDVCVAAPSQ